MSIPCHPSIWGQSTSRCLCWTKLTRCWTEGSRTRSMRSSETWTVTPRWGKVERSDTIHCSCCLVLVSLRPTHFYYPRPHSLKTKWRQYLVFYQITLLKLAKDVCKKNVPLTKFREIKGWWDLQVSHPICSMSSNFFSHETHNLKSLTVVTSSPIMTLSLLCSVRAGQNPLLGHIWGHQALSHCPPGCESFLVNMKIQCLLVTWY